MWKHKKFLILVIIIGIVVLFHFVPVYSRTGTLDNNPGRGCIDYVGIGNDYHRIIPGGLSGFTHDKKIFNSVRPRGVCEELVTLRLYLW